MEICSSREREGRGHPRTGESKLERTTGGQAVTHVSHTGVLERMATSDLWLALWHLLR